MTLKRFPLKEAQLLLITPTLLFSYFLNHSGTVFILCAFFGTHSVSCDLVEDETLINVRALLHVCVCALPLVFL